EAEIDALAREFGIRGDIGQDAVDGIIDEVGVLEEGRAAALDGYCQSRGPARGGDLEEDRLFDSHLGDERTRPPGSDLIGAGDPFGQIVRPCGGQLTVGGAGEELVGGRLRAGWEERLGRCGAAVWGRW